MSLKGQMLGAGLRAAARGAEVAGKAVRTLRASWGALPKEKKIKIATAAAVSLAAAGVGVSKAIETEEQANEVMAQFANYWSEADATKPEALLNMLSDMIAGSGDDAGALYEVLTSQMTPDERQFVNSAWSRAVHRASATKHTGDSIADGQGAAAALAAYDQIRGDMQLIREAAAILNIYDVQKLAVLRDFIFMDQQRFNAAISRV